MRPQTRSVFLRRHVGRPKAHNWNDRGATQELFELDAFEQFLHCNHRAFGLEPRDPAESIHRHWIDQKHDDLPRPGALQLTESFLPFALWTTGVELLEVRKFLAGAKNYPVDQLAVHKLHR